MSRIEQLIDEIEEFLEGCKKQTFSQTNIIVPKDELLEMLNELRLKTPEEVKSYKKIIENRDQIIADAQAKAESMVAETEVYVNSLVEEHEIMLKAYERAEALMNQTNEESEMTIQKANADAEEIRRSALLYTQSLLNGVEKTVSETYETFRAYSQELVSHLELSLDTIKDNKQAIAAQVGEEEVAEAPKMTVKRGQEPKETMEYSDEAEEEDVIDDELYEEEELEEEEAPAPKKKVGLFGRMKKASEEETADDFDPDFDFDAEPEKEEPSEKTAPVSDDTAALDELELEDEEISVNGDTAVLENYDDIE